MAAPAVVRDAESAPAAMRDGELVAQRDAPLGGQAVLEGVMMRGVSNWAVAVRKPASDSEPAASEPSASESSASESAASEPALGEIEVSCFPISSPMRRHRVLRLPIVRGVVALGESLAIGFRALGVSANAQLPPGEGEEEPQEISSGVWFGTVFVALVFAIGLFFLI